MNYVNSHCACVPIFLQFAGAAVWCSVDVPSFRVPYMLYWSPSSRSCVEFPLKPVRCCFPAMRKLTKLAWCFRAFRKQSPFLLAHDTCCSLSSCLPAPLLLSVFFGHSMRPCRLISISGSPHAYSNPQQISGHHATIRGDDGVFDISCPDSDG